MSTVSAEEFATQAKGAITKYKAQIADLTKSNAALTQSIISIFEVVDLPTFISGMKNIMKTAGGDPDKVDMLTALCASVVDTSALDSQIADLTSKNAKLRTENIALSKKNTQLVTNIDALTVRCSNLAKIMGGVADKTGITERKPTTFPAAFDDWFAKNGSANNATVKFQATIATLEKSLQDATIKIEQLCKNEVALREEVANLSESKKKATDALSAKDRALKSAFDTKDRLQKEVDDLTAQVGQLTEELEGATIGTATVDADEDF